MLGHGEDEGFTSEIRKFHFFACKCMTCFLMSSKQVTSAADKIVAQLQSPLALERRFHRIEMTFPS